MSARAALTCLEMVELVTGYVEGTLVEDERHRFDAHVSHCPDCLTYVEQMRLTIDALGSVPPVSISAGAERALLRAFRDWTREERGNATDPGPRRGI